MVRRSSEFCGDVWRWQMMVRVNIYIVLMGFARYSLILSLQSFLSWSSSWDRQKPFIIYRSSAFSCVAINNLYCAEVSLRNCSLSHWQLILSADEGSWSEFDDAYRMAPHYFCVVCVNVQVAWHCSAISSAVSTATRTWSSGLPARNIERWKTTDS